MKNTLSVLVSLLFLAALVAVNIQLTSAQSYTCSIINCGAGDFVDGGIDSSLTCPSPNACWWNNCTERTGNCPPGNYSRQCSQTGPVGCPNTPCVGEGQSCVNNPCCDSLNCQSDSYLCEPGGTPIMINLKDSSSNYHLTSYTDGVRFDINATGVKLQVGW